MDDKQPRGDDGRDELGRPAEDDGVDELLEEHRRLIDEGRLGKELEPEDEAEVAWSQTRVGYPLKQYLDVLHAVVKAKKGRRHVEAGFPGVSEGHVREVLARQARDLGLPVEVGKSPKLGVCVRYREPKEPNPFTKEVAS